MNLSKLAFREKIIVGVLIVALTGMAYFKMIHAPFSKRVRTQEQKIKKYRMQLSEIEKKIPEGQLTTKKIESLKSDSEALLGEIRALEKTLPPKKEISQLIGEFTRLAKEAKLVSIRQKTIAKEGYNRVFIEIKLAASYPAAIHYISHLESISPFLRVEEADINESKGKSFEEGGAPVRVVISSLLGDEPISASLRADESLATPAVKRDILVSRAKPLVELSEKDFKLEGITFSGSIPTAIINGDVYRVDSEIKGFKIKKIMPDSVLLTDGTEDHLIALKR